MDWESCANSEDRRQSANGVVESRAHRLEDLSNEQVEYNRDLSCDANTEYVFPRLFVCLANDFVWVGFSEGDSDSFEITDLLFGPFDFMPTAIERMGGGLARQA